MAGVGVTIAREPFRGWEDTYRVTNGLVEARVVADVGPRIIALARARGPNLFHVREDELGGRGEPVWRFRGGWRLWLAPERRTNTYALDNAACAVERLDDRTLRVTGPPQPDASVQKSIDVAIDVDRPRLQVTSRIRNVGTAPVTYAAWTLAVMRPGGRAFVPLDVGPLAAFDAVRRIIVWSYARLDDPRYRVGGRLIEIDSRVAAESPAMAVAAGGGREDAASVRTADESKIGVDTSAGWAAYHLDGTLFVSDADVDPGPRADGGATVEVYSSREFIEIEHLGTLTALAPGDEATLREGWWLVDDVAVPPFDAGEDAVLAALSPHVADLARDR